MTQLGGERWQRAHASLRAHTARMLARDPDQRFADGADVLRALAELDESQSWRSIQVPTARPVAQPVGHTGSRRGARREAAGTVMAAVGLGAVAAVAVEQAREHGPAVDSSLCERCPEAEVASAWSTSQTNCQTIEIPRITSEVREGHGIYPAIPLIFQR